MKHEHYEELAAGYAVAALEPDEEQAFLLHLAGCASCERELAMHRETLAHLASDVEPVTPPPALLETLRREVLATGRPVVFPGYAIDELSARRSRWSPRQATALTSIAAGLVLVMGLTAWNVSLRQDQDRTDELSAMAAALVSGGGRTAALSMPGTEVAAVAVLDGDKVHLVASHLRGNDAAATSYVLWQQERAGQPEALMAFDVRGGTITVVKDIALRGGPGAAAGFAISLERGNGLPEAPTLPLVATGLVD
ncbi:MAG TPA: anti-sigma factor [Mycobacteriales bacterium]|nr:anti-sigma factor [Mycobacteriales bacterium]